MLRSVVPKISRVWGKTLFFLPFPCEDLLVHGDLDRSSAADDEMWLLEHMYKTSILGDTIDYMELQEEIDPEASGVLSIVPGTQPQWDGCPLLRGGRRVNKDNFIIGHS
jgi:hypothetical protein